jgi:hypothetical protein
VAHQLGNREGIVSRFAETGAERCPQVMPSEPFDTSDT